MNRDEIRAALNRQAHQLRQLQERVEAIEAQQSELLDELNAKHGQLLKGLRFLCRVIEKRFPSG